MMPTGELDYIIVDDNNIKIFDKFIFLGVQITNEESCIFKDWGISLIT